MSMLEIAVVGLGKMGLSHQAMINSHPDANLRAVCDSTGYVLDIISKYTGIQPFTRFEEMLDEVRLDAVIISTPTNLHASMVRAALSRGLHVFCEKPFCLTSGEADELSALAHDRKLVNQVGYHHRFIGTFKEVKRLLDLRAIGDVTHILAEAYGPVVLRQTGSTWRTKRSEGGSCLYDYAAHPLNLLNWYLGDVHGVGGSTLNKVFSTDTEDEVVGTLYFADGKTAQIFVNWSDESHRKMSTKITIWGTRGSIVADRQELNAYFRSNAEAPSGYNPGWNVRYTTELSEPVWFYLRGEEYSAQLDHFIHCIKRKCPSQNISSFATAAMTDRVISMMLADAQKGPSITLREAASLRSQKKSKRFSLLDSGSRT